MIIRRAVRGEAPFFVVLGIVAFGFCYMLVASGHWLRGVSVMAAGMVVAAGLRAVLPNGKAGMLAVRGRFLDSMCYLTLGLSVFGFGILVPQ
jgi:hypothetical protein